MDTPTTVSRESVELQFDRWLAATLENEHKRLREEIDAQRAALQAKSAATIRSSETK
jgi:hypothetical protein